MGTAPRRPFCPNCGWNNVRLAEQVGFVDLVAKIFFFTPLRCRNCRLRFYRLRSVAKRAQTMGTVYDPAPAPSIVPKRSWSSEIPRVIDVSVVSRRIILLLDDDPALRKLLRRLLDREGYEVREAADAGAAAAALRDTGIDLVIVNLSDRNAGEAAVQGLRRAYPELMVMVLSEAIDLRETSERLMILPRTLHISAVVKNVRDYLMSQPVSRLA